MTIEIFIIGGKGILYPTEQSKIVEAIPMPTYAAGVVQFLSLIKDDQDGIVLKGEVFMKHTAYMKTMLRC